MQEMELADMAEIRMDLLTFSPAQFEKVFSSGVKLIATYRPFEDVPGEQRMDALGAAIRSGAIRSGASYVDIEYEAGKKYREELIKLAKAEDCEVIISYHNFNSTPSLGELKDIVKESIEMGADVVKIAAMANSKQDQARVLGLYDNDTRLVAFCMGAFGTLSRLMCVPLGAEFTFAALDKDQATAPGQLTKDELKYYFNIINQINYE